MTSTLYDFAIIGHSPTAKLLAGILARDHKRRCVLLGESRALFRLPQTLTTSLSPLTRPEHWSLLANAVPETLKLLSRIGAKTAVKRTKALLCASDEPSRETLSHVKTMATLHGHEVELTSPSILPPRTTGFTFLDTVQLDAIALEPHLNDWLRALGVQCHRLEGFKLQKDGSATLSTQTETIAFRQTLILDDQAIIDYLPVAQWPRTARRHTYSSLLLSTPRALPAPLIFDLSSGAMVSEVKGSGVYLITPGDLAVAHADTEKHLPAEAEPIGQSRFTRLVTVDNLPAFGRVTGNTGAQIVLNAAPYGAFLTPALARWIAGVSTTQEQAYFDERRANRSPHKTPDAHPTRLMSLS